MTAVACLRVAVDVQELAQLGDELQIKLLGEGEDDAGEVGLLLFEGSAEAVQAFAALDDAAVSAAAANVPFVTGPGVCRLQTAPVGGRMQPPEALPLPAA